jgi:branched-chain amino acid transport system permease protein
MKTRHAALAAAAVVVLAALPPFLPSTWLLVMFLSFLWLILTANYDVLDGFLGHINLGQGAFFGLAAYVTTMLLNAPAVQALGGPALVVAVAVAVLAAALFAAIMAIPLFRLKGLYFAIATLILIFLLQVFALNLDALTGGSYGLYVPPRFFVSTFVGYYLALSVALVALGFNYYLSRSTLGLAFRCLKEDEEGADSIGLSPRRYKTLGFVLASVPSAAGGALFALNAGFIDPTIALGVERSLLPPLMALLGGTGTVLGPVFGTAIIRLIETVFFHYLRLPVPSMLFFGLTLMVVALLVPEGLLRSAWVRRLPPFRALSAPSRPPDGESRTPAGSARRWR